MVTVLSDQVYSVIYTKKKNSTFNVLYMFCTPQNLFFRIFLSVGVIAGLKFPTCTA